MAKTATIRAMVQPELKTEAEEILRRLGLSTTDAITLFYSQIVQRRGLPFEVALPNEITRRTFTDTDAGRDLVQCDDAEDMFAKLGV